MPSRNAISDSILTGMSLANVTYEKWSNGRWLTESGAEGLMVSSIAGRLSTRRNAGESVVVDLPFRSILEWSGADRPCGGRAGIDGRRKLADIVLLDRRKKPACVVEVNRAWNRRSCFADLAGIRDLVIRCNDRDDGSLKRGYVALMLARKQNATKTAGQRVEERAVRIEGLIRDEFDCRGLTVQCRAGPVRPYPKKYRLANGDVEWAHASFCIELSSR